MAPALSRRAFTFGVSAAAGCVVLAGEGALARGAGPPEITAWVVIEPDGATRIRVARSEMGQGALTALPMLVAEELECDWSRVRPEYAAPSESLARGRPWGPMVTAGSLGVRSSHLALRRAGAQARTMLIAEAAARWGVPPDACAARDGVVRHGASGRALPFGEIAAAAALRPVPADVPLKPPEEWRLIGRPVRRLDTPDKVFGRPIFASDVRLPGMLHAAVRACPALGGKRRAFEPAAVAGLPGVRHVLPVGDAAVAVVADTWWQAHSALERLPVTWDEAAAADLSTPALRSHFRAALEADDLAFGRREGDVAGALRSAAAVVEAEHEVPYLAHATMEPQTCAAHVAPGRVEVWAPTQNGEGTLQAVARALGVDPATVVVNKCALGGGFGRRGLAQDWAVQAVLIARQIPEPVKLQWTRQEDVRHDVCRPMVVARQTAGFDAAGRLVGWRVRLAGSSILAALDPGRLVGGRDLAMCAGYLTEDMAYGVPHLEVGYAMRNTPIPVGFWRGVNHTQNGFFRESFVDEMAHARGQDPVRFRRALLARAPRQRLVLDAVAERIGWGGPPAGAHHGIALVESYDAVCCAAVELGVDRQGQVAIHRVVVGLDAGFVVNPDTVAAQMEGSVAWGLSAVLHGEITHTRGRVDQSNFHDYPVLRMDEMPPVETLILSSGARFSERWGGVGEPGVPPVAPAVVNAVFSATGRRVRSLPLKNHDLRPA